MLNQLVIDELFPIFRFLDIRSLMKVALQCKSLRDSVYFFIQCRTCFDFKNVRECGWCLDFLCMSQYCKKSEISKCRNCSCVCCGRCKKKVNVCYSCESRLCSNSSCSYSEVHLCSKDHCERIVCGMCYSTFKHCSQPLCRTHLLTNAIRTGNREPIIYFYKNRV